MIYVDNAATTRLSDEALQAMLPYFQDKYGNASTLYRLGREAHTGLEEARRKVACCLGAGPMEICFTSGGTEADNWAVKGTMRRYGIGQPGNNVGGPAGSKAGKAAFDFLPI